MLKTSLISSLILAYPDFERMFIIDVDASGDGFGAVLSQNIDGSERMVSYASRSLTKAERGYCATRREMRGLVWVTREFRPYICGVHFLVKTDHNRIRRLQNFKEPEGQVFQWLEGLVHTALDGHMEMRAHSPDKDADNAEEERRSSNPL
ncbi:Retrovirus-related Pol polyprotein from transposon [Trichinella zimbabwensis]|uniref:Retrovirus-related Pol polyprotein from transposon n=1 Tax=Trichinella zimbabwensis TaxID=268475 RepID=A0A0V1I9A2_9BILA|nr:Retrovirus-related Pol polyprotein from transposon [Trichinella zimbabwensis]